MRCLRNQQVPEGRAGASRRLRSARAAMPLCWARGIPSGDVVVSRTDERAHDTVANEQCIRRTGRGVHDPIADHAG